jgi:hypothetical protein
VELPRRRGAGAPLTTPCSGICTLCGRSYGCRAAPWSRRGGARGSAAVWLGPSKPCVCGSRDELAPPARADQAVAITNSSARSARSWSSSRRSSSRSRLRATDRGQARRRDRRRTALRDFSETGPRCRRRADPRQLGRYAVPTARPGRQPPDQRGASLHQIPAPAAVGAPATTSSVAAAWQEHPQGDPLPQALPRPPRLAKSSPGTSCRRSAPRSSVSMSAAQAAWSSGTSSLISVSVCSPGPAMTREIDSAER